jgi:glycosyltransferase involved in cell wall biosynthesis
MIKKTIIFTRWLHAIGGGERLMLEIAEEFAKKGIDVFVVVFGLKSAALFDRKYTNLKIIELLPGHEEKNNLFFTFKILIFFRNFRALRKKIKEIRPDCIIGQNIYDAEALFFATIHTRFSYSVFIHGTIFWWVEDTLKYAGLHKRVFQKIRNSVKGHREFINKKPPGFSLFRKLVNEIRARLIFTAVNKTKLIFVLSNQMKWEVKELYGKNAVVAKGAFGSDIFRFGAKPGFKKELGLEGKKVILNVNRLDPRKRIVLLVEAFHLIAQKNDDVILLIGGAGPEEEKIKAVIKELGLTEKVKLVGRINENELYDYYAICELFVHPNWADYAIAPLDALALKKKVVWSTEVEMDEHLLRLKDTAVFEAEPCAESLTKAMEKALAFDYRPPHNLQEILSVYTWHKYAEFILARLENPDLPQKVNKPGRIGTGA